MFRRAAIVGSVAAQTPAYCAPRCIRNAGSVAARYLGGFRFQDAGASRFVRASAAVDNKW